MQIKLNGWQRLWVVAASIYLLAVCGFVAATLPDGASLELERATLAVEAALRAQVNVADELGDKRAELNALRNLDMGAARVRSETYGDLTNVEVIQRLRAKFDGKADFTALDERVKRDTDRLRDDRSKFILQAVAWWVIPALALYALGSAIGWIVRGFRNKGEV
ncbi:MAG: hypothetical protein ACXV8Q_19090 [Methylobacter sp.]